MLLTIPKLIWNNVAEVKSRLKTIALIVAILTIRLSSICLIRFQMQTNMNLVNVNVAIIIAYEVNLASQFSH